MNHSAEHIKKTLFALTAKGIKYDLRRMRAAASYIGNPHKHLNSVHVAGTNGKGSTCTFIETILRNGGWRTGLFTSPHLIAFEERFRINGTMVNEQDWLTIYSDLQTVIKRYNLTFFEATMLIALELFKRHSIEWAIFETGMGGRLDATNIIHPNVSVITRIAMDHMEYLGTTIEAITDEKLGIVKERTPLVIADPLDDNIRERVLSRCRQKKTKCTFIAENLATSLQENSTGVSFYMDGISFSCRMPGRFQVVNALCAIEAIRTTGLNVPPVVLQKGIASASLPGRFQILSAGKKKVILDVGHNPDAVRGFCATIRRLFPEWPVCIVTGIMADKDYTAMITMYMELAQHIIITQPKIERATPVETLALLVPEAKRTVIADVKDAVRAALQRNEHIVAVTGSFYTAGEAIEALPNDKM